jgi:hypothetical protein
MITLWNIRFEDGGLKLYNTKKNIDAKKYDEEAWISATGGGGLGNWAHTQHFSPTYFLKWRKN